MYFEYYKAMDVLHAKDRLELLEIQTYTKIKKKEDRDAVRKKYLKQLNIEQKPLTGIEMTRKLEKWQTKK